MKRKILWTVLPALVVPLIASLFYFVWFSDHPLAATLYFATKLFTVAWPAVVVLLIFRDKIKLDLKDPRHLNALLPGLLSGVAVAGLLFLLVKIPTLHTMLETAAPEMRNKAEQLGFLKHYLAFALFLSILHSLIEEYYWRWFVYGHLRKIINPSFALVLSAIAFGSHHVVVTAQYFPLPWGFALGGLVAAGGAMWSLLLDRQRTIVGAWLSHMIIDLAVMWVGYRLLTG
jgi:membrane protease YdiL (CAAX protease family)